MFQAAPAVAAPPPEAPPVHQVTVVVPSAVSVWYISIITPHCPPPPPPEKYGFAATQAQPSHHFDSITQLVLLSMFAAIHMNQPFDQAPPPEHQLFGVQSQPPPPDQDGHLYCVVVARKLAGFASCERSVHTLYTTL